ncbi:MAG: HDOD domain-containing protein [Phycisphaerales bacterium]|nr:MAG: HDOD domain-containing protein [Phycisphaerales bacterium]
MSSEVTKAQDLPCEPETRGATVPGNFAPTVAVDLVRGVSALQALPEVAQKVRDIAADPQGTVTNLAEIITSDPALASKLLKLANSAFYGLPSQVSSIHRAIVILGFKTVQNLALAGALCGIFRGARISPIFSGYDLWKHCLAVAVAARKLAKAADVFNPEEAFLAGVTHDVGMLAVRDAKPDRLAAAIAKAQQGMAFLQAERTEFGTDHTEVGWALTSVWRFPDNLRLVCRHHHAPADTTGKIALLIHTIHLADWLCGQKRIGLYLTQPQGPACSESLQVLGLEKSVLGDIRTTLDDDIAEAERVFS